MVVAIIYVNLVILVKVFRTFDFLMPDVDNAVLVTTESSSITNAATTALNDAVPIFTHYANIIKRLDASSRKEFARLIITPILYLIVGVPILLFGCLSVHCKVRNFIIILIYSQS